MSNARKLADNLPSEGSLSGRNLIINGAMEIAQRGTSQSNANPAIGSVDRMRLATSGGTASMSQQTMSATDRATTGFNKYLRVDFTSGNNNGGLYYNVEAADILHAQGKKLTLSFWAKGTNPGGGSFTVPHYWYDGSNQDDGTSGSLTITSSWVKYAITFDTATASSASLTSANSRYDVAILQPNGDTSTNAWQLNITGLMLEIGSQATPFEHEPVGVTLAKCQRYYYAHLKAGTATKYIGMGDMYTTTQLDLQVNFPVPMRVSPTLIQTSGTTYWRGYGGNGSLTVSNNWTFWLSNTENTVGSHYVTADSSTTPGFAMRIINLSSSAALAYDAEL